MTKSFSVGSWRIRVTWILNLFLILSWGFFRHFLCCIAFLEKLIPGLSDRAANKWDQLCWCFYFSLTLPVSCVIPPDLRLLPVWKWHWNSQRKILACSWETLKQSYGQMKAAIPDSINIKNHLWAPVKLYCFPPGLDCLDPRAHQAGEDSPTLSLPSCSRSRREEGSAMLPSAVRTPPQGSLPARSPHRRCPFPFSCFSLITQEARTLCFTTPRSNMNSQSFTPCRRTYLAALQTRIGLAK